MEKLVEKAFKYPPPIIPTVYRSLGLILVMIYHFTLEYHVNFAMLQIKSDGYKFFHGPQQHGYYDLGKLL